jgi:hypothetical protein
MPYTWKGRVVYDRPKHQFGYGDVNRILKAVNPATTTETPLEQFSNIWSCMLRLEADLVRVLLDYTIDVLPGVYEFRQKVLLGMLAWILDLLALFPRYLAIVAYKMLGVVAQAFPQLFVTQEEKDGEIQRLVR